MSLKSKRVASTFCFVFIFCFIFCRVPGHISNYAYEKLVERFLYIYHERRQVVNKNHDATKSARENIDRENEIAEALQRDLDREKQVRIAFKVEKNSLLSFTQNSKMFFFITLKISSFAGCANNRVV